MSFEGNRKITIAPEQTRAYLRSGDSGSSYAAVASEPPPVSATDGEAVSIKGMVTVPVASNYTESKQSLNELSTEKGDMAEVPNIDLCEFMSGLSGGEGSGGISTGLDAATKTLDDVVASINGLTLTVVESISSAVQGAVTTVDEAASDLGAALDVDLPTVSCGKYTPPPITAEDIDALGDALVSPPAPVEAVVEPVPYGVQPTIVIESPDVTVDSLDDEIDLGEF